MSLEPIFNSAIYAFLGVAIMAMSFFVIDMITPGRLWEELLEKRNTALAIVAAGVAIAVGMIVASAIH